MAILRQFYIVKGLTLARLYVKNLGATPFQKSCAGPFQRRDRLRTIKNFFPRLDDQRREGVKADVILRILSIFQPRPQGPLTFEKLTGKK